MYRISKRKVSNLSRLLFFKWSLQKYRNCKKYNCSNPKIVVGNHWNKLWHTNFHRNIVIHFLDDLGGCVDAQMTSRKCWNSPHIVTSFADESLLQINRRTLHLKSMIYLLCHENQWTSQWHHLWTSPKSRSIKRSKFKIPYLCENILTCLPNVWENNWLASIISLR